MACKIKNNKVTSGGLFGGLNEMAKAIEDTLTALKFAFVPSKKEVDASMFNLFKNNVNMNNVYSKVIQAKELRIQTLERLSYETNEKALAIGKRIVSINKESFGPTDKERRGLGITIPKSDLDALRLEGKRYWTTDDNGKYLIYLYDSVYNKSTPFEFINYNIEESEAVRIKDISMPSGVNSSDDSLSNLAKSTGIVKEDSLYGTKQWVLIQNAKSFFTTFTKLKTNNSLMFDNMDSRFLLSKDMKMVYNEQKWETYVKGGVENNTMIMPLVQLNKDFYDYSFEIDMPFSKKELEKFAGINKPLMYNIVPEYNFYMKDYETSIKSVNEILIPNMYIISSEVEDDIRSRGQNNKNANTYFDKVITMNGVLDPTPFRLKMGGSKVPDIDSSDIVGEYYDNYARRIQELYIPQTNINAEKQRINDLNELLKLDEKLKYIGIPISNTSILNDFYDKRELYPMYVDIQFSTDRTTQIAQILKDSKLSSLLTLNLMKSEDNTSKFNFDWFNRNFVEATEYIEEVKNENGGMLLNKKFSFERNLRRTWNITTWLKDFDDQKSNKDLNVNEILDNKEDIGIFLDQETDEVVLNKNNPSYIFFRNLLKIIFIGKLRKLIKDKFRTYEDMVDGKLAYSETVLYRIEKKLADRNGKPTGDAIQNFYFPNANEIDILKFIDTQVKYGVPYIYTVYAYQSVIGTKYHYDDVTVKSKGGMAWFSVTQEPSILLVEVPYCVFSGAVVDDPPICPDVDLIPYKGINNEMLIFMNGGTGDYLLDPITIEPKEKEALYLYRKIKGYDPYEKIRYKADDFNGVFQVYRIDEYPESYNDFAGNLLVAVESDFDINSPQGANSAAFRDSIKPNKKYWYCFRAIDVHGHFSNPSPVFQMQMIDNKGTVFPLIEVVDFKEKKQKEVIKNMKRFMYIAPRLPQTLVNESKMGIEDATSVKNLKNVYLGIAEVDVWGKQYMVRVTSKQTGKILEFILNFDYKFNRKE